MHGTVKPVFIIAIISLSILMSQSTMALNNETNLAEIDLVGLYNPLGLSLASKVYWRNEYRQDASPLWDGLYYQAGAQLRFTPAYSQAGLHIEWLPVAVIQLKLQYDRLYFSGDFGSLLSFSSADQPFDDNDLEAREGEEVSTYASRMAIGVTLQARVNKFIVRNILEQINYEFPGNGPFYLEREFELLLATDDQLLSNQLYLLVENKNEHRDQYIGPYHDYVHVDKSGLTRERLGLTWLQQYKRSIAGLQEPRWYIQAGYYLQDPNRKDELYFILGIGGDFEF